MKDIKLTFGQHTIVDDEDWNWLKKWEWKFNKKGYAQRKEGERTVQLHRVILNAPENREVDHINGDGLDNRKENLRLVTRLNNAKNRKLNKNNKSGVKGVSYHKRIKRWQSEIQVDK